MSLATVNRLILAFGAVCIIFGIVIGVGIGMQLQFDHTAKEMSTAAETGHILKNPYGYFEVKQINFSAAGFVLNNNFTKE